LHQLFWRQTLAAKKNGINKEKQDTLQRKAQSLSPKVSSNTSQSGIQTPSRAAAHSYSHGRVTRLSPMSEERRRPRIGECAYAESSSEDEEEDDEEEDNQSRPNPVRISPQP